MIWRNYTRKNEKEPAPDMIIRAVDHYCTSNNGIKRTVERFGVARSTLRDHHFYSEAELRLTGTGSNCQ